MVENKFYSEQILQLIFEEIRLFREVLRKDDIHINIPSKFELLLASIPKSIRIKILDKMEPELKELNKLKNDYELYIKKNTGYTQADRDIQLHIYDMQIYVPFLSYVIDELDNVFRQIDEGRTVDPRNKFG